MKSPTTHPTLKFPQKQPQNGRYGRLPLDLLPKILSLSNQEAKVFMVLSMLANFKREPLGMVECQSLSDLARKIGIPRRSFQRSIAGLKKCGLVTHEPDSCVIVSHYLGHDVAPLRHEDAPPATPCLTISPQPQPSIDTYTAPIGSEEVSEEEVKKGARKARKARSAKASPPFHPLRAYVRWDKDAISDHVVIDPEGTRVLRNYLAEEAKKRNYKYQLTDADLELSLSKLSSNLIRDPRRQGVNLVHAVFGWFRTDLITKNNHPQRGKPLAQRIDEKTKELINGNESSDSEVSGLVRGLLESGSI